MVRLILTGGLGNQMFEYAAGRTLSLRLGTELTIDPYALDKKTKGVQRSFELDVFEAPLDLSSSWKTKFVVSLFPLVERHRKLFGRLFGYFRDRSAIVYLPEFESLSGNVVLHGHFQNEKYFEKYQSVIRKDFTFKNPLADRNAAIALRMGQCQSVSVHIRRGDYVNDATFALCSREYYQEAIETIEQRVENPFFFVFSQDFNWVKENLTFDPDRVVFVDWNKGHDSYIDMQLMSLCRHNIIANSSFSWWAAWLNTNPQKMVFAPSRWFAQEERNKDLNDFYPDGWQMTVGS